MITLRGGRWMWGRLVTESPVVEFVVVVVACLCVCFL